MCLPDYLNIFIITLFLTSFIGLIAVYVDKRNNPNRIYEIYQDNHGFYIKVYESYVFLKIKFKNDYTLREDIPQLERKPLDESMTRIKYYSTLEDARNYIKKLSNPTKLIEKIS